MIEMEMIVKTDQYQQAWSTIMPKLSEYTFINHEPDEELDEETFNSLEEGKKHLLDVHCFYKSCTFYNNYKKYNFCRSCTNNCNI